MIDNLQIEGVNTDHIIRDEHVETGAAVIMVDHSGEKQIFAVPGANAKVTVYDVLKAESKIRAARVILAQLEVPIAAVEQALRIGCANGATTVLDPAPPRLMGNRILRDIDLIRPNSHEASFLTGIEVTDRASARLAAEFFLENGVHSVVIGAGSEGDLLVGRDGEFFLPRIPVETVDATGAGDAFTGALAVELARQEPLVMAATFASGAAALATTQIGGQTGLPREDAVRRLLMKTAA